MAGAGAAPSGTGSFNSSGPGASFSVQDYRAPQGGNARGIDRTITQQQIDSDFANFQTVNPDGTIHTNTSLAGGNRPPTGYVFDHIILTGVCMEKGCEPCFLTARRNGGRVSYGWRRYWVRRTRCRWRVRRVLPNRRRATALPLRGFAAPVGVGAATTGNPWSLAANSTAVNAGNSSGRQANANFGQADNMRSGANNLQAAQEQ